MVQPQTEHDLIIQSLFSHPDIKFLRFICDPLSYLGIIVMRIVKNNNTFVVGRHRGALYDLVYTFNLLKI